MGQLASNVSVWWLSKETHSCTNEQVGRTSQSFLGWGHIKFWSRKTISQLLNENGFRVVRFIGAGRLPLVWKSMIVVAQKS
jgi:hypothetical protein